MGSQEPAFSAGLVEAVSHRLGSRSACVAWQEVYWADVLEARERELWDCMQKACTPDGTPLALAWKPARELVVHNFGDAIAYHRDQAASAYDDVHARISSRVGDLKRTLRDPGAPIVVMAHSLGGHMMSNYIWDRQHRTAGIPDALEPIPTLVAMITFGCNIPLFSLSYPVARPITLPGAGITSAGLAARARWLNFLDHDDVLGWPMAPLYTKNLADLDGAQANTVALIEERAINVGSALTSWNPVSHSAYWTDGDFTGPVADYLGTLLDALDA
jgi:hypothetical protein